ncbi:MAG TPA: alpha/beta fold hydrolase, partial [Terriglobales bacterium]|nr:alpha/beta fold hydrolase [Terriglobales bacterium]
REIESQLQQNEEFLKKMQEDVEINLRRENIPARVEARIKRPFSVYQKMKRQKITLDQVYDLLALRIITDSVKNCYAALGVIHNEWHPIPGRIKDFIAIPRQNLYQSLHTSVIGPGGRSFEVQIRAEEMHRQRNIFSIKLDGSGKQRLSREDGNHKASFADNGKYFVDTYSALMTPPRISVCSVSGSCNVFWSSRPLTSFDLIKPQFVDFTADDGTVLHGELFLPAGASAQQKVPLLMNPYGGPEAQQVQDHWGAANFFFDEILAHDGIAVLRVDNRGMGFRGKKFATVLRHQFGKVELNDQLTALDQALNRFPQLDGNRLGWWGWSYGGFMTTYAMTHARRFKAGVAVAPVTDWHAYDSIYTERYMGLPKDNADGYKSGSVQQAAANLSGHLLIVHGTSDDNVHVQNTIQLAQAFINSGKQFELLLFPRKTHAIAGVAARTNLYERIRAEFDSALLGWSEEKIAASNPAFPLPSTSESGGH